MDAETRAEAERLGMDLVLAGKWPRCAAEGMPVRDTLHGDLRLTLVAVYANGSALCVKRFGDGTVNPTLSAFPLGRLVPDLDAPATWGVLLGLLDGTGLAWSVAALVRGEARVVGWATTDAPRVPPVDETGPPGLALSRALRVALAGGSDV